MRKKPKTKMLAIGAAIAVAALQAQAQNAGPGQDDDLRELLRKQSAQIEKLQADLQQLRQRVNQPDGGMAASSQPAAVVKPAEPAGPPGTVAPAAQYSGLIPDVTVGRVVTRLRGDVVVEAGHTSQRNDANLTSSAMRDRFRLIVNPEVKGREGTTYGGLARYVIAKGDQSVNAPDRAFVYARGTFGELSAGVRNGYADEANFPWSLDYLPTGRSDTAFGYMAPNGGITGGAQGVDARTGRYQGADISGGVVGAVNGTGLVWPAIVADNGATKLMYVSPRVSGVRFGVDWTPRNDAFHISTNRLDYTTSTTLTGTGFNAVFRNVVTVGADYDSTFNGVRVLGNVAYMTGKSVPTTTAADSYEDLRGYQAGLRGEYRGFALGATVMNLGKSGQQINSSAAAPRFQENTYNTALQAQYKWDRWVVGGVYRNGQDPGQMNLPGTRKLKVYELGLGYTVWDGLQLQLQYDHFVADSDKAQTAVSGSPSDSGNVLTARAVYRF